MFERMQITIGPWDDLHSAADRRIVRLELYLDGEKFSVIRTFPEDFFSSGLDLVFDLLKAELKRHVETREIREAVNERG
jgi:hypothetical protein